MKSRKRETSHPTMHIFNGKSSGEAEIKIKRVCDGDKAGSNSRTLQDSKAASHDGDTHQDRRQTTVHGDSGGGAHPSLTVSRLGPPQTPEMSETEALRGLGRNLHLDYLSVRGLETTWYAY